MIKNSGNLLEFSKNILANKKFAVLAKKGDQVKIVRYGDPNLKIKKAQPKRRKSFRERHNCDAVQKKKDVFTAGYWSCKNL